jgi:cytochrome P450
MCHYFLGTDTVSSFLEWFILYMVAFPDVQEKVADEIRSVVGDRRKLGRQLTIHLKASATIPTFRLRLQRAILRTNRPTILSTISYTR